MKKIIYVVFYSILLTQFIYSIESFESDLRSVLDSSHRITKTGLYNNENDELLIDNIRLASLKDITAMKIEVIQNGGRKKDF